MHYSPSLPAISVVERSQGRWQWAVWSTCRAAHAGEPPVMTGVATTDVRARAAACRWVVNSHPRSGAWEWSVWAARLQTPRELAAFGLNWGATKEEVREAFTRVAHRHHPDKGGGGGDFSALRKARDAAVARVAALEDSTVGQTGNL